GAPLSCCWGARAPYGARARAAGVTVIGQVGAVAAAGRSVRAGVDVVIAQGAEAGGHVAGQVATSVLVPRVVDAVSPTPVVAAGGIADARGLVAALALGAVGIWCGTPFLATPEAGIDNFQKEAIVEASSEDAIVSRCMTGKPVRQLTKKWAEEFEASGLQPLPMPFQSLIAFPILEGARQAGMKDIYPGIAGQSVGLLNKIRPAREIVEEMVRQAIEILNERFPREVRFHP